MNDNTNGNCYSGYSQPIEYRNDSQMTPFYTQNQGISNYYPQSNFGPIQGGINQVNDPYEKIQLDIFKKQEFSKISIQESEIKAKIKSDIEAQKKLQLTQITSTSNGDMFLLKQQFGDSIQGKIPIKLVDLHKLKPIAKEKKFEVLVVRVQKPKEQTISLVFRNDQLENRFIQKQFDKAGIDLGFGMKKSRKSKKN